jgi:outer membrane lipoprotein-sorting protein
MKPESSRSPALPISCPPAITVAARSLVAPNRVPALVVLALAAALTACAPKAPALPTGTGTPFAGYAAAYEEATASCREIKTLTASMAMSGKAGTMKMRGRIDGGFAAPGRLRLEGIPPFGKPVFVLVADGPRATLVLTRDDRVLRDAPADRIVEALAGVPLGADALRALVSGCGLAQDAPSGGREFPNGWIAASSGDATTYLRRADGRWQMAAATRGSITATYADYANGRPATIRVRADSAGRTTADLTLRLSDVETNTTLDPKTFEADLPQHPIPITLEELRRAGPLGGS